MSRFIDKLQEAADSGGQQPMGFARSSRDRTPSLLIIASLTSSAPKVVSGALKAGADALFLVSGDDAPGSKALDGLAKAASSVPWGVSLETPTGKTVQALKEKGCDFIIFPLKGTPSSILRDEGIGKVLQVDSALEERLARGIDQLAMDAVLAKTPDLGPLTLNRLLEYLYVFSLTGQLLLSQLPHAWSQADLEELRDGGVSGLVVPFQGASDIEEAQRLKQSVVSLPPRSSRRREALHAHVPYLSPAPASVELDDDDD